MTTVSRKEVKDLLVSFKEALEFWILAITENPSKIKSATVENPLAELGKLIQLIKAHTTKVGIIFKPDVFVKQYDAAYNTISKSSETLILLVSIIPQLKTLNIANIFYEEIILKISNILTCNVELVNQLMIIEEGRDDDDSERHQNDGNNDHETRLVSIGKIWSSCDNLMKVLKDGELGLLNLKFKQSIMLIEDGLDDFEEWSEDPQPCDDPFGFDLEDESDNESDLEPTDDIMDETVKHELTEFSQKWLNKFKLVKLLLSSISKSLPSITSGSLINEIYDLQKTIVNRIDKLIVELMMSAKLNDLVTEYIKDINKCCNNLLVIVKTLNKSNENKVKWCEAWENKFKQ